jgi:hypothetical protein
MSLTLTAIVSQELALSASAMAEFVWFGILPKRPDAEFEERMQRLAAESAIENINAQSGDHVRFRDF